MLKRSPLKGRPLRNPGQSLDEQIRDATYDTLVWPVLFALFLLLWAGMEWFRYVRPHAPNPVLYTIAAALATVFAVYRIIRGWPRLRALRLGRDGEKAVGQYLERLREQGYQVFHDVVGERFNIDHVLIGPAGIFTVETKTHSKPTGNPQIEVNAETIRINGFEPDRDPVVQAKAQAGWLRELLSESTGQRFDVKGVIVYPGWWVNEENMREKAVWVLEPKRLPVYLSREPARLSRDDIHLASFHLSRFMRTAIQ